MWLLHLEKIDQLSPDIVLLDVEMEDGTGFDLLRKLISPSFQLIFVTAHDKYALEAFQFSAIDYLLKPVDPEAFRRSMEKAILLVNNMFLKKGRSFIAAIVGYTIQREEDSAQRYREYLFCKNSKHSLL